MYLKVKKMFMMINMSNTFFTVVFFNATLFFWKFIKSIVSSKV